MPLSNKLSLSRTKKTIRLLSGNPHTGKENFGDTISPVLIERIFGIRCELACPSECDIIAAGSTIEHALSRKKSNRPALWGTGFIVEADNYISSDDFDIVALRGEYSKGRVETSSNAIALGDPGVLANFLLHDVPKKKYSLGIVPHYRDVEAPEVDFLAKEAGVKVISVRNYPECVVREIAECDCILASSLHGLVVADSLGIPNVHIKLSNKVLGGSYKFKDYYSAFNDTSRYCQLDLKLIQDSPVSQIVDKVIEMYREPTDLDRLKSKLISAFPFRT